MTTLIARKGSFKVISLKLLAALLYISFSVGNAQAQNISGLKEAQTLDGQPLTALEVGQTFRYRVTWQCSFTNAPPPEGCGDFLFEDTLPAGMTVQSCVVTTDYSATSCVVGSNVVEIDKTGGPSGINLGDGDSAEAFLIVKLSSDQADYGGAFPPDITNTASITSGEPLISLPNTVPLNTPTNNWKIEKRAVIPIAPLQPALDVDSIYQIEICPDGPAGIGTGTIPLTDVTLTDVCEVNASFEGATHNGAPIAAEIGADACPNLQFSLGTLNPDDGCDVVRITLQYPSTFFSDDGSSTVINTATAADAIEGPVAVCDAPCSNVTTQTIAPANPDANISKGTRRGQLAAGALSEYTFGADLNSSNVPLTNVVIADTFPAGVTGLSLSQLSWADNSVLADVIALGSGTTIANGFNGDIDTGPPINYTFAPGDTGFSIEFSTDVPPGFVMDGPTVSFRVDIPIAVGTEIENCVNFAATEALESATETDGSKEDCAKDTIIEPRADISSVKSMPSSLAPGEEFTATFGLSQDFSSSTGAIDPVVVECLPPELLYVSWDDVTFTGLDDPRLGGDLSNNLPLGVIPNLEIFAPGDAGNNCTVPNGGMLRWSWNSTVPAGALQLDNAPGVPSAFTFPVRRDVSPLDDIEDATGDLGLTTGINVEVTLQVVPGTLATALINNTSIVQPASGSYLCLDGAEADAQDLDDDSSVVDVNCADTEQFGVIAAAAVGGQKFIGGFPGLENIDPLNPPADANAGDTGITPAYCPEDNPVDGRTRAPCIAQGMSGQPFNYQVRLSNDGNVPLVAYVAYDILPYTGDIGVTQLLSGSPRGSTWTAEMLGPITVSTANTVVQAELDKIGDLTIADAIRPKIEYSASTDPCRDEMAQGADGPWQGGACDDDWTETPLADPITFPDGYGSVAAWRLVMPFDGSAWPAGDPADLAAEDIVVDIVMSIPPGTPGSVYDTDTLEIAWNNIGHRATNGGNGGRLLASEMRKTGIAVPNPFPISPDGVRLGNLVWMDIDNDGLAELDEPGLYDVTVQLWQDLSGDGPSVDDVLFDVQQTDAFGHYLFDDSDPRGADGILGTADDVRDNLGFAEGDYYVVIPDLQTGSFAVADFYSSTGAGDNGTADDDADNDDNGSVRTVAAIPAAGGDIIEGLYSGTVTLTTSGEPVNETDRIDSPVDDDDDDFFLDAPSNTSVDFGFYQLRLGNHIWLDNGAGANTNNGIADSDEAAIEGLEVELWLDDGDMVFDPNSDTQIVTPSPVTTDAEGQYLFEGLDIGDYFVAIPTGQSGITADGATYSTVDLVSSAPLPGGLGDDNVDDGTPGTFGGIEYAAVSPLYPLNVTTALTAEADTSAGGITGVSSTDVTDANVELSINLDNNASLPDVNSFMSADFSFVPTVNLGSTIWIDIDGDGLQEAGELPMGNVTVTLLNADGSVYDSDPLTPAIEPLSVLTDADGQYNFNRLPPGTYRVQVDLSTSNVSDINIYSPSPVQVSNADDDNNLDSNLDFAQDPIPGDLIHFSAPITLLSGTEPIDEEDPISDGGGADGDPDQPNQTGFLDNAGNMTLDLGFVPPVSLGSTLWVEIDANGIQNSGEEAIAGATITLLDGTGALFDSDPYTPGVQSVTTLTNADGEYNFNGLPAGDYRVRVELPAALSTLIPTPVQTPDPDGNSNLDSNIASGSTVTDVWESGTITLVAGTEPESETDPINAAGDGVASDPDQPDQGLLSDDDPDNAGNMTVDFGFIQPVSLGSRVWIDANSDGLQSPGEATVSGVVVTLMNADGSPFDGDPNTPAVDLVTAVTDANGQYNFNGLPAGDYRVQIDLGVASTLQPTPIQVADPEPAPYNNIDSNIDPAAPGQNIPLNIYQSGVITLSAGDEPAGEVDPIGGSDQPNQSADEADDSGNMTLDFGLVAPVSIGSVVWLDANGDGIQNLDSNGDAEPGITGAIVTLLREDPFSPGTFIPGPAFTDLSGAPVAPIVTGPDGAYFFDNLTPGNYKVQVTTPDATFFPTINQVPLDNALETDSNINLAAVLPANAYESGVINLLGGMEVVEGGTPVNNDDADDAAIATDNSGNMTVDFGFFNPVSIGSLVWEDTDGDGIQDLGESPITQGLVTLLDAAGNPVSTDLDGDPIIPVDLLTGSNGVPGTYQFTNLPPGDYQVQVSGLAGGFAPSPVQTTLDNNDTANDSNIADEPTPGVYVSGMFSLENGTEPIAGGELTDIIPAGDDADDAEDDSGNMTVDFGFVQTVSIGSVVWLDADGNGVQNAGEALIDAGTVRLLDGAGNVATGLNGVAIPVIDLAVTGGTYFFSNLPEGDYIVEVTPPVGYAPTPIQTLADDDGANELDSNIASEPSAGVYRSGVITLEFGAEVTELEADGLAADGDDADNAADTAGDMTVDFGFVRPVSIGSVIWQDLDGDGIQDTGEPLINVGTVTLLDSAGNPVTIDIDGNAIAAVDLAVTGGTYLFDNLPPGDYQVQVTALAADLLPTPTQTTGDDDNTDNDSNIAVEDTVNGIYTSGTFTLNSGAEPEGADETTDLAAAGDDADDDNAGIGQFDSDGNMTVDMGFVEPVSIGSIVWEDTNGNGLQDTGEVPIEVGSVTLLDGAGVAVTTDINGDPVIPVDLSMGSNGIPGTYFFDNLPPGEYRVQVTDLAAGFAPSPVQNTADNDDTANDSNIATEPVAGEYVSGTFTLTNNGEPTATDETSAIIAAGDDADDGLSVEDDNDGNMTVDFGFVQTVSIGSVVWLDADGNGVQNAGEALIDAGTVRLLDGAGNVATGLNGAAIPVIDLAVTGGTYFFSNLPEGDYIVEVTPPVGYAPTPIQTLADDDGANELDSNIASEPSAGVYRSGVITLEFGAEVTELEADGLAADGDDADNAADAAGDMTVDFGFVRPVSIGSVIWQDLDGDGIQDTGEPLIDEGMVTLLDGAGNPVAIDIDGNAIAAVDLAVTGGTYLFDNLPPGDYQVQVTALAADLLPTPTQTTGDDDNTDNDSNIAVEDTVNGIYTSGTFTLNSGAEPEGADETTDLAAAGDDADDDNAGIGQFDSDGNMTVDMGFVEPVLIGSAVWEDVDRDGIQDVDEPLVTQGTVTLLDGAGNPVTLDINGDPIVPIDLSITGGTYLFDNLPPGDYQIQVSGLPTSLVPSPVQNTANDDDTANDSNVAMQDIPNGIYTSGTFTLTNDGEPTDVAETSAIVAAGDDADDGLSVEDDNDGNMTVDMGFTAQLSLGSLVWEDSNADGIQDANEPPIAGVDIVLLVDDGAGTFIPAVDILGVAVPPFTTGPDGLYLFENLPNGSYQAVVTPPVGLFPSPIQGTADDDVANDSNIFGEQAPNSGVYLSPVIVLDSFTEPSEPGTERGDAQDDAGGDTNGNMTLDFGFVTTASIGNYVWLDLDMDGIQDANEDGIAGVEVTLTPPAGVDAGSGPGVPITTTTGPDGGYLFPDLPPFENADPNLGYLVTVNPATLPTGLAQTYDEGATGMIGVLDNSSNPIQLSPMEEHLSADFGYAPPIGSVGNTIWIDSDDDGVQDPFEPGIAGVTVSVTPPPDIDLGAGLGLPITTVTDNNGRYLFAGFALNETYIVEVDIASLPPGYVASPSGLGDPDVRDGNSSDADNLTFVVLSTENTVNLDADFGYLPPADQNNSVGDTIWIDVDEDGNGPAGAGDESDVGEQVLPGVTVALIDNATGAVIANDITDANGQYLFAGIPDGAYTVVVTDQNNVLDGLNQTVDSDDPANPGAFVAVTPDSSVVDLDSASVSPTPVSDTVQDFGYVDANTTAGSGTIGDTIFYDENDSAAPDAGEGLEGVTVLLYGPGADGAIGGGDDVLLDTQQTDENGNYLFTGLDVSDTGSAPGTEYRVEVDTGTLPNGGSGWINSVDPDTPNPGDSISVTTLTAALPDDLDQDFGYLGDGANSLSGTVWPDTDGDGNQDEAGSFAGVTIELQDQDGNIIATTSTDADGNYMFENLPDGVYKVVVTDEDNVLNGFEHTDSPNGPSDTGDLTSKDDTGYLVDLDSAGVVSTPVEDSSGDFGYKPTVTNPISLGSFLAASLPEGGVQVDWATQTEIANLGFNVYGLIDGDWVQLNDELILGQGDSVSIQRYQAVFDSVAEVYALSDIDFEGTETLHGPFMLGQVYGVMAERKSIDWNAERIERDAKRAKRKALRKAQQQQRSLKRKQRRIERKKPLSKSLPTLTPTIIAQATQGEATITQETSMIQSLFNKAVVAVISVMVPAANAADREALTNLHTTESGIHEVSVAALSAEGVDIVGEASMDLALMNQGQPVAVQVTGGTTLTADSVIRFIAKPMDTLYTDTNVYTLLLDSGSAVRMQSDARAASGVAATSYLARRKVEPQNKYSFTSPDQDDPWYMERLVAIGKPASKVVQVDLKDVAVGGNSGSTKAKLRVGAYGSINLPGAAKDHNMTVTFNGRQVASERFDGLSEVQISATLESVNEGNNNVVLTLPMDTGYAYDAVNLDEVEIQYPRKFVAEDNQLKFTSTFGKFRIRGFDPAALSHGATDLVVVREDADGTHVMTNLQVQCNSAGCLAQTPGTGKVATYYVASTKALHAPVLSELPLNDDITSGLANYLIISHPDFIGSAGNFHLENLKTDLESEMGSVDIVDVESIYAQFGDYLFDPQAIKDYIKYAHDNRGTRYVLLVGGDVYDYRRFENEDATSFIPSIYAATGNNITFAPVDAKYVDLDNDNVPDIPIGRLPVRTVNQLGILVNKRTDYINRHYAGKVLLVADEYDDAQQYDFSDDADEVAADYLSNFQIETAYVDVLGTSQARAKVKARIEAGTTLTAFFGHSSTNQWSFNGLFTGPDAAGLNNQGKPTVVTQWGCWNAYYVSPNEDSMGHRFMMEGDRGAVAVMGASTLTDANSERQLAKLVFERLANGERLGDAVTNAKQEYALDHPNDLDVLLGWTVLGMPELVID